MNNEINYVSPFKNFVITIGNLPTAYLESMSYYEAITFLVNYLSNNVIPALNNNGEVVEELQQKFTELKNYVETYFDNLDVQEEINNKLDEMAEDGSLTQLIKDYVDPIYSAYETRINANIDSFESDVNDSINSFESNVNDSISSMNSQITSLSSGSPAGVYATVTDLTNDNPSHDKIYLVSADGKWYYYDTSSTSWVAGGTYQSTGVGDNEIDVDNLVTNLQYSLNTEKPSLTYNAGHFVSSQGLIGDANNFNISSPIHLNIGDKIEFYALGYENNIAMLSTQTSSTRYNVLITSEDNNYHIFTHTALYEADYYISSHYEPSNVKVYRKNICTKDNKNMYTNKEYIDNIIFNKTSDESFTVGKYLGNTGNMYDSANYDISDYIEILPNEYITLKDNNTLLQYTGSSVYLCEYDINKTFIKSHNYGNTNYITFQSDKNAKYLRLTLTPNMKYSSYNLYYSSLSTELSNLREKMNKKSSNNILKMFTNITCIGDSLTQSIVYTGASSFRDAYRTYPDIIGTMTGATITNLSHGGDSASASWNRWNEQITQKTNQLTIIYLGTNDGLTDTVNTDCVGNDYTQYANTNTGNYGKIIKKSLDVGSKVILIKCYAPSISIETINKTIEDLAQKFNVVVVDNEKLTDNLYHYFPDLTGTNGVHYNDLGYEVFTEQLINNINNLSNEMKSKLLPV